MILISTIIFLAIISVSNILYDKPDCYDTCIASQWSQNKYWLNQIQQRYTHSQQMCFIERGVVSIAMFWII